MNQSSTGNGIDLTSKTPFFAGYLLPIITFSLFSGVLKPVCLCF